MMETVEAYIKSGMSGKQIYEDFDVLGINPADLPKNVIAFLDNHFLG